MSKGGSSFPLCAESPCNPEEGGPAQKKRREQLLYLQSEEFQKILNAKSRHGAVLQAVRTRDTYFRFQRASF